MPTSGDSIDLFRIKKKRFGNTENNHSESKLRDTPAMKNIHLKQQFTKALKFFKYLLMIKKYILTHVSQNPCCC